MRVNTTSIISHDFVNNVFVFRVNTTDVETEIVHLLVVQEYDEPANASKYNLKTIAREREREKRARERKKKSAVKMSNQLKP